MMPSQATNEKMYHSDNNVTCGAVEKCLTRSPQLDATNEEDDGGADSLQHAITTRKVDELVAAALSVIPVPARNRNKSKSFNFEGERPHFGVRVASCGKKMATIHDDLNDRDSLSSTVASKKSRSFHNLEVEDEKPQRVRVGSSGEIMAPGEQLINLMNERGDDASGKLSAATPAIKSRSFNVKEESRHFVRGSSNLSNNDRERLDVSGNNLSTSMPTKTPKSFHFEESPHVIPPRKLSAALLSNPSKDSERLDYLVDQFISRQEIVRNGGSKSFRSSSKCNSASKSELPIKSIVVSNTPSGGQKNKVDELADRLIHLKKSAKSAVGVSRTSNAGTNDRSVPKAPNSAIHNGTGAIQPVSPPVTVKADADPTRTSRPRRPPLTSSKAADNDTNGKKNNRGNAMAGPKPPPPPPRPLGSSSGRPHRDAGPMAHKMSNSGDASKGISLKSGFHHHNGGNTKTISNNNHNGGDSNKNGSIKSKISSKPVMDQSVMDALSEYNKMSAETLAEAEASDFKKFGSLSLPALLAEDSIHDDHDDDNKKMNNNSNNNTKDNHSSLSGHDFNSSTMCFAPRPVRVTQFEDNDGNTDAPTTPKTRPKSVTTMAFLNSIRQQESNEANNSTNALLGDTTSALSLVDQFGVLSVSSAVTSNTNKNSASSSRCTIDCLPENVDKKGRCVRHPRVRLFKKKILGGYELLRDRCPSCEKEAPYEDLWRERARSKERRSRSKEHLRSDSRERTANRLDGIALPIHCSPSLMHGGETEPAQEEDEAISREGSGSGSSFGRKSPKKQNNSIPSPAMTTQVIPPPPLDQSNRPSTPLRRKNRSPNIQNNTIPTPATTTQGIPPPPLNQGNPPSTPLRRRNRKSSLERPRSNPRDGRRGRHTPSLDNCQVADSKSLLSVGIDKLSSLQNRARSSSVKRASFHEVAAPATPHLDSSAPEGDRLGTARGVSPHSPKKLQKPKFDKKTGRCKHHPSILMARKAKFNKGWDIIRECPRCLEEKKAGNSNHGTGGGGGEEFSEVSKEKMNALLHGSDLNVDGGNCQQPSFDSIPFPPEQVNYNLGTTPRKISSFHETKIPRSKVSSQRHSTPEPGDFYNNLHPENEHVSSFGAMSGTTPRKKSSFHETKKPSNKVSSHRHSTPDPIDSFDNQHADNPEVSRVSRMPYTTPWGESGWYTGQVNISGKPHGQGRMRAKTGNTIDGEWTNGYSAEYLERQGRMKSGFGTNIAEWKKKDLADPNAVRRSSSVGRPRSGSESRGQPSKGHSFINSSNSMPQYPGSHSQGQYPTGSQEYPPPPPPHGAYHPSPYGMVPSSTQPEGMWSQSPGGYQSYPMQSHSVSHNMRPPPPAYRPGYY